MQSELNEIKQSTLTDSIFRTSDYVEYNAKFDRLYVMQCLIDMTFRMYNVYFQYCKRIKFSRVCFI